MKKIYLTSVLFLFLISLSAQEENSPMQGEITYEQIVKMEIHLEGDASAFNDMLPKERKSLKTLLFNSETSLYQNKESDEENNIDMSQGGANVMIKMEEPENIIYTDLTKGKQVEQQEFMTRTFLIEGATENKWKITGKQKTILDYPCQEAELEGAEQKTVAWFTPVIPVSAGPGNYGGLPGMILAVNINEGNNTITATSVDFGEVEEKTIAKPQKGKKVSREEFEKIVEEKMKEMGAEEGEGGTQFMIKIKQ